MAGEIDTTSAYFASLAAQAAGRKNPESAPAPAKSEKKKSLRFERILSEQKESADDVPMLSLPPEIASLPESEILSTLLDSVSESGDALKERPVPDNIVRYKEAVRNFMKFVVSRAFSVETSGGIKVRKGLEFRQKQYTQIHVIDEKLEKLAGGILSNQKDKLAILAAVEEINGLLVDMLS